MGPSLSLSGLGVNQTKVIAGSAYIGSCMLTKDLVAALLGHEVSSFEPAGVTSLLSAHEVITGASHAFRLLPARNQFSRSSPRNDMELCLSV